MGVIFIVEDVSRMRAGLLVVVRRELFPASSASIVAKSRWREFFASRLDTVIEGVGKLLTFSSDLFMSLKDIRWYRPESSDVSSPTSLEDRDVDRIASLVALALLNAFVIVENKFGVSDDLDERSVLSLDGVGRGECFLPRASFVSRLSEPEPDFIVRCAVRCK